MKKKPSLFQKILAHHQGGTFLFLVIFLFLSLLIRLTLLIKSNTLIDWNITALLGVFTWGLIYDFIAASYCAIPLVLYLALVPERLLRHKLHQVLFVVFFFSVIYMLLFDAAAEWVFWDEFGVRFNFIAVDYLVYTKEVIGNIFESYPMPAIFGGLLLLTGIFFYFFYKTGWIKIWGQAGKTPWKSRLIYAAGLIMLPIVFFAVVDESMVPCFDNNYNRELARNGLYSLFAAFRNNELDYCAFYPTEDNEKDFQRLRTILKNDDASFLSKDTVDITRFVKHEDAPKHYNIIQITVESLSSKYLGVFGNSENLTPNIDILAKEGILFTNFHATGTRTVRGMEALTLSLPPTPGRSIVKRPHNEHLFSLGSLFKNRGYDTVFLYGGHGYFDNMNYFFGNNGYRVVDRASVSKEDVTFANIWGACDEDLFKWVLREADNAYADGNPFYHFVMTTSNHRPFTYPEERINIPSHTGRRGGVKYTDYAIGEFMRKAREKPWFDNTVFVIVADHCGSSAGKTDLPVKKYEIPLIIYNPKIFAPQQVSKLCSQIDFPPTLLALMGWSYKSRFYGKDIFQMKPDQERALIANYQMLGLMKGDNLVILKPLRQKSFFHVNRDTGNATPCSNDNKLLHNALAYYQSASYLVSHYLYTEFHEIQNSPDSQHAGALRHSASL